jgi:hypothetical protein
MGKKICYFSAKFDVFMYTQNYTVKLEKISLKK